MKQNGKQKTRKTPLIGALEGESERGKAMCAKVHIINAVTYEIEEDGFIEETTVLGRPPHLPPVGQIWHSVLGKFVPKDWKDKEMWLDEKEVFGDEDE